MNISNIGNRTLTEEEKQWRRYYRVVMTSIKLMPDHYDCTQSDTVKSIVKTNNGQFSSNYNSKEDFDRDRDIILQYLDRKEYAPKELVDKVAQTVKELNIQFLE